MRREVIMRNCQARSGADVEHFIPVTPMQSGHTLSPRELAAELSQILWTRPASCLFDVLIPYARPLAWVSWARVLALIRDSGCNLSIFK